MFFQAKAKPQLSAAEMQEARRAFRRMLQSRGLSAQFIANHGEELLAIAFLEYVRYREKGTRIESPVGWLLTCAWRRTQNLLQAEAQRPQAVSTERLAELADESATHPEQIAEASERAERAEQLQGAMEELSLEQRQVVALLYFQGLSFSQAGRILGWSSSKAVRRQRSALAALRGALGADRGEWLAAEAGLAALLSLQRTGDLGGGGRLEAIGQWIASAWPRAQDLARRILLGGGDAAGAAIGGGGGRAFGLCAGAVALACLAGANGFLAPGAVKRAAPPPSQPRREAQRQAPALSGSAVPAERPDATETAVPASRAPAPGRGRRRPAPPPSPASAGERRQVEIGPEVGAPASPRRIAPSPAKPAVAPAVRVGATRARTGGGQTGEFGL